MDALVLDAVLARPLDVSAVAAGNAEIAGTVQCTLYSRLLVLRGMPQLPVLYSRLLVLYCIL